MQIQNLEASGGFATVCRILLASPSFAEAENGGNWWGPGGVI